jgi:hypothetical protein
MTLITIDDYSVFIKEMFFLVPTRPLESSKNVSTIASIEKQDTRALVWYWTGISSSVVQGISRGKVQDKEMLCLLPMYLFAV